MQLNTFFSTETPIYHKLDKTTLILWQKNKWVISRIVVVGWFTDHVEWVHSSKGQDFNFDSNVIADPSITKMLTDVISRKSNHDKSATLESILKIIKDNTNADFATTIESKYIVLGYIVKYSN